jgi:hypothetical protein
MSNWTIQDQENSVKAATTGACFLSWLSGIWLLEQICLFWPELKGVNTVLSIALLVTIGWFLRKLAQQPGFFSYGWRMREICGEFQDEYLRTRFQRATCRAFHLMTGIAITGHLTLGLVADFAELVVISNQLFPLLILFSGNLSFYMQLRGVLDDSADETSTGAAD